jgi:hypothetical protein
MKKKHLYVIAASLTIVGVALTTGIVSKAAVVEDGILKLEKDEAWTDFVPTTGRDNPVYVSEDEIIYTDSQGNKVFEYLNPVDPGNEPATMPDTVPSTEGNIQGDVMMLNEPIVSNESTSEVASTPATAEITATTVTTVEAAEPTTVQPSTSTSDQLDTSTQLPTGTSKVVENEYGLLIQVFE